IRTGWGHYEAHDDSGETDETVELTPKVLHRLTATDAIIGRPSKVTAGFAPLVANTGNRGRVHHRRLFELQGIQHDLQTDPHRQDHRPQIPLASVVAAAFIESGEERQQTRLVQPEELILAWFADQFLLDGNGD